MTSCNQIAIDKKHSEGSAFLFCKMSFLQSYISCKQEVILLRSYICLRQVILLALFAVVVRGDFSPSATSCHLPRQMEAFFGGSKPTALH